MGILGGVPKPSRDGTRPAKPADSPRDHLGAVMSEVRRGYKQTEVGVIPEDWEIAPLDTMTTLLTNGFVGTATSAYVDDDEGVLYIQGYNVIENGFNLHGIKRVSRSFHVRNSKSCLQVGDLLTIQTGEIGVTTIVPPSLAGANCHALVISRLNRKHFQPDYYCHYFNSVLGRRAFKEIETGTTMKHVNVGDMKSLNLPVPGLEEQRLIGEALSDADALIESLEQLLTKKRQIKQGAMQEFLTGKKRLPGFQSKPGYQKTDVGLIPSDWDARPLGQTARSISRGASPRPIDSPEWFDERSSVGWVRISDVTKSGRFLSETSQRLSEAGIHASRFVPKDSLIMSICATVGRPIQTKIDVCIHDGFVVFDRPSVDQAFLYHALKELEPRWSKSGQTGSQMNLNTDLIKGTRVALPMNPEEQTAIASVLSDMDSALSSLETKLAKARQLKQGMMQNLLTGKIRLV